MLLRTGDTTPPTHLATCAMVTLRVGLGVALGDGGGAGTGRDAVADGDLLWPDEDVLDEQLEDPASRGHADRGRQDPHQARVAAGHAEPGARQENFRVAPARRSLLGAPQGAGR